MKTVLGLSFLFLTICLFNLVSAQSEDRHHPRLKLDRAVSTEEQNADYWKNIAEQEIEATKKALNSINTNIAKNIIIFVGDGMSLPTLTASRIYKAQYEARKVNKTANGEESLLFFEKFPHGGLSRTYCVDAQTPDSAATANAMFTGVKTNYYTMGFDNTVDMGNVSSEETATKVDSILTWAQKAGKDTGFVTTTRISHATPAALYAHSAERYWECNKTSSDGTVLSTDITVQFVHNEPGINVKVALGGGRASFLPSNLTDEEKQEWGYSEEEWKDCERQDYRNLVNEYLNKSQHPGFEGARVKVVKNRGELNSTNIAETDYLLGLFGWGYMKYEHQREKMAHSPEGEPSLAEMTEVAIKMLKKSENGFFLMVEGGKIDVAHHDGWANVAVHETMAMDKAVEMALSLVDIEDTLIIVTADHGHTMSMGGYQTRGADIRGIVDNEVGTDDKPYSILSYANGPGFYDHLYVDANGNVSRVNMSETNFTDFEIHQPASAPLKSETHSGADVGIFAIGPFAHFFRSVHEQNYIAYVMAYSACIGPYENDCHTQSAASTTATKETTMSSILLLMTVLWMSYFY